MIFIAYLYPISLAIISVFVALLERFFPLRREQKQWREALFSDFLHLIFNGHFLGIIFFGLSTHYILPYVDRWFSSMGLTTILYRNAAASWPLWAQIIVALLVVDFIQWTIHNLLHRVPFLWGFHKCHHSVVDGEMDWIVSFRFQWTEVAVYKAILYLPLAFFGFSPHAVMFHAIFGTLIGHLNHANLDLGHGAWRYILNSPRMHIWHHYYEGDEKTTVNFGIIFSMWDWIFGTAKMPDEPPSRIGFPGVEEFPSQFFGHVVWPLQKVLPRTKLVAVVTGVIGAGVLLTAWLLHNPKGRPFLTPMLGEKSASSRPASTPAAKESYSQTPQQADAAIGAFGQDARKAGYKHPGQMVSVRELARALGASRLVLLDIRPSQRFESGHIPSARQLYRGDYSSKRPIPGLSKTRLSLQQMLRTKGVMKDSVVVLYTDGGPEAFRLWWTLKAIANYPTRILNGSLNNWKMRGHAIAEGPGVPVKAGDVVLGGAELRPALLWRSVQQMFGKGRHILVDTRNRSEFVGKKHHKNAARPGHIPKAVHMVWHKVIKGRSDRRLKSPQALAALFGPLGLHQEPFVLTYCQSGTRSAALYFALYQLGYKSERMLNYDGSWAEYSRLTALPAQTGD